MRNAAIQLTKSAIKGFLSENDYKLVWCSQVSDPAIGGASDFPVDFDQDVIDTVIRVQDFTMTSPERIYALCQSVRYVVGSEMGLAGAAQ